MIFVKTEWFHRFTGTDAQFNEVNSLSKLTKWKVPDNEAMFWWDIWNNFCETSVFRNLRKSSQIVRNYDYFPNISATLPVTSEFTLGLA